MSTDPRAVVARLQQAMNQHDIESFVAGIATDFHSEQPAHPGRTFRGRDQVRANWSAIFAAVPDFRADLLRVAAEGDTVWSEWAWRGQRADGAEFDMRGVIVMGIAGDQIAWARLYMEETEQELVDITAAVERLTGKVLRD